MHRVLRAAVYAVLVTVTFNALLLMASRGSSAARWLLLCGHAQGFTLGIAAGAVANSELALLGLYLLGLFFFGHLAPLPVAYALVAGGLGGAAIRAFIRSHREPLPERHDR